LVTESDEDDSLPTRELKRLAGGCCHGCGVGYSPHEAVFSVAMGFKTAPRCLGCLAAGFDREPAEFRGELVNYVLRRECYRRAWEEADRMTTPTPDAEWDAGDLGCGDLVLALRLRLKELPAGAVLAVRATDPAAPEDLPAWCGLTGHTLVAADHPRYLICRK
jgi:tRNA 2-thiouridine synthesizing protein A